MEWPGGHRPCQVVADAQTSATARIAGGMGADSNIVGTSKFISGAVGPSPWGIHEHTEAVKVVNEVAAVLRSMDVDVISYEDTVSKSQDENLDRIVAFHNSQGKHDLDVSIHFNSTSPQPGGPVGSEVFYASSAGQTVAKRTVDKICIASGLKNRGPKSGNFAFLNNTNEVAVLVEVCFVNSHADVDIYHDRFSEICVAIAEGLADEQAGQQPDRPPVTEPAPEGPGPDVDSHPTLKKGDQGEAVRGCSDHWGYRQMVILVLLRIHRYVRSRRRAS